MDHSVSPHTTGATAHPHLTETWDQDHLSFNETLVAGRASSQAFDYFLSGSDLFIAPRTRSELESVLRRYAYDSIHNAIAMSRQPLQHGGYSRTCMLAEESIRDVLNTNDNAEELLDLHAPPRQPRPSTSTTGRPLIEVYRISLRAYLDLCKAAQALLLKRKLNLASVAPV